MNHTRDHDREQVVCPALTAVAPDLVPAGKSAWRFHLLNGAPHPVTAKADGGWLVLEADCDGLAGGRQSFWDALAQNASLTGLAKIVLAQDGRLRLRADIPLLEGADLTTRVREVCGGFVDEWTGRTGPLPAAPASGEAAVIDLKGLCAEAGWPVVERGSGKLAVELEIPGGFGQALLIPCGTGVRITREVAALTDIADECRQAIGGLLLAASGLLRLGRASLNTGGSAPAAQFEVVFGAAPSASEISSALECLSVGCSLCGEEIKMLRQPAIAEHFLALRGWEAVPAAGRNEGTPTS